MQVVKIMETSYRQRYEKRRSTFKIGRNETVHMDIILKICDVLDCNIDDILEIERLKWLELLELKRC